jgi:type IV pilus assembly protein PilX
MPRRLSFRAQSQAQRGATMLVVLILMSVMLLGGLALARVSEVGALASGNVASRDAAMQASEAGLSAAFTAVRGLADENTSVSGWYWNTIQAVDSAGAPSTVNWDSAPSQTVGRFTVRYVAERMCNVATVTDPMRQCLVRMVPQRNSAIQPNETPEPPNSKQFRITVRVTETAGGTGKGTDTLIQSLVTKG